MAYDLNLADRLRRRVGKLPGFEEKAMFGGLGFLHRGNMCCGVWKEFLILRIGIDAYRTALAREHVRQFDITGKSMKGWVMVEAAGVECDDDLWDWLQGAVRFVHTLPSKHPPGPRR